MTLSPNPDILRWRSPIMLILLLLFYLTSFPRHSLAADDQQLPATTTNSPTEMAEAQNKGHPENGTTNEEERSGGGEAEGAGRALAAPTRRGQENAVEVNGERKPFFKIHYRDGFQKAIFDETQRRVPADFEDTNDVTGGELDAYDDARLVEPRLERPLFIPEIYRNESSEEEEEKTKKPGGKKVTPRPLVAPDLQSRQPIIVRTTTVRPPGPSIRPAQPFGRPRLPQQPRPPQPQGTFPPRPPLLLPQQSRPPPQLPRPQQRPSPSGAGQLRSGICPHSIFYTPQAVSEFDLQRIYTHFAVVQSVDQCARTCHEFNCDVAILDPVSRHCQFNPSTAFRLHPSCPQWPNPLFRNNLQIGQDPVRIACVTCQQRRRGGVSRPTTGQQNVPMPFNGQGRQQQQAFSIRRPISQQQQQNVIRTATTRDRIDADSGALRIANAAPLRAAAEGARTAETERGELSAEFTKLESMIKSAEDYLDETEEQQQRRAEKDGGGRKNGREVPSWREGHPQGEGFSPLKINPLRRPYLADLNRPRAIFYSTDTLSSAGNRASEQRRDSGDNEFRRRRTQREAAGKGLIRLEMN